jgi:hypothetical protein
VIPSVHIRPVLSPSRPHFRLCPSPRTVKTRLQLQSRSSSDLARNPARDLGRGPARDLGRDLGRPLSAHGSARSSNYSGSWNVAVRMVREEGPLSLYKGFGASLLLVSHGAVQVQHSPHLYHTHTLLWCGAGAALTTLVPYSHFTLAQCRCSTHHTCTILTLYSGAAQARSVRCGVVRCCAVPCRCCGGAMPCRDQCSVRREA